MHWTIKYPSSYCYYSCINKECSMCKLHPDAKPERIEVPDSWDKEFYQSNASQTGVEESAVDEIKRYREEYAEQGNEDGSK